MSKRKIMNSAPPAKSAEEIAQLSQAPNKGVPGISPAKAREIMAKRKAKKVSYRPISQAKQIKPSSGSIQSFAAQPGLASNTVQSPASITELARALKNDVDLIYYHVYNQIEYYPTFGLQKGSLGALIDGIGNPWDQCQLMVDLLTEAGYTASFMFGDLDLSNDEIAVWLGTDSSNIYNAYYVLQRGGIPCDAVWTGTEWRMTLSHIWVKVTIDSTDYYFDPSYKSYSSTTGIDLGTAMSYSHSSLISAAETGATIDTNGNWIQDVDYDGIKSELSDYSMNLVDYIKTNNPTATLDDIIGGRTIDQISSPVRNTSLDYLDSSVTPTNWTTIPNTYRVTVDISNSYGISESFYADELYGKRITVWYNTSVQAELRVDGTLVATGSTTALGTYITFYVHIVHPYPVTWYDEYLYLNTIAGYPSGVGTGKMYWLLGLTFGATSKGMVEFHEQKVAEAKANGAGEFDEDYLGEQLAVMWYQYAAECSVAADIIGRMTNCMHTVHHWGFAINRDTEQGTVLFDGTGFNGPISALDGDSDTPGQFGTAWAMHANALERLVPQQFTGKPGVGISNILETANAASSKIYRGDSSTYSTDVDPNLTNYSPYNVSSYISGYLSSGYVVVLPEDGWQTVGNFDALGWALANPAGGAAGFLAFSKGGASEWGVGCSCHCKICEGEEADPVGLQSGAYKFRQTDMTLGSSSFPYQLRFEVEYSSSERFEDGPMGWGWSHCWQLGVSATSEAFRGLGSSSPIQAAASLVSFYTCIDLVDDDAFAVSELVTAWLTTNWWCDQMFQNVVSAQVLGSTVEFVVMPDGTYQSTDNDGWQLSESSGEYTVTTPQQIQYTYNTDGDLATIDYPNGVTITLSYTSGKLTSVSNGMGRTLTLSYTADKLTGVSDGNSRSISYAYDVDGQLDTITDLMGEDTTFTYADIGQIESYFLPENPTSAMVTNTYDVLGRIKYQLDSVRSAASNFPKFSGLFAL